MFITDYINNIIGDFYLRMRSNKNTVQGDLLRDGVHVIPNYVNREEALKMGKQLPDDGQLRISPEGTHSMFYTNADELEAFSDFFTDDNINNIMRSILGKNAVMLRAVAQKRVVTGYTGSFEQFFHIDSWRHRYKAFLYLTDVQEENAPFVYVPKTHYGLWRVRYDVELKKYTKTSKDTFLANVDSRYAGCLFPHQANQIFKRKKSFPKTITGEAGTLILFDARGIHKIRPLQAGTRKILYSYWIKSNHHV